MKELKRNIAIILALCLVFTGIVPAYADEVTLPEQSLVREETENAEILHTQEAISDTVVSETDKDMNSDKASSDDISYEDETILENIEKATPANADYDEPEEVQDDTGIDVFEEATPANAEYIEEFIREIVVDGIKITLTADPGVFPEDAELWAEKVEDEATEEAIEEAVEKERENDVNVAASYKFDIKMFVNGEEVQPDTEKGSVKVTFTIAEELNECLDVNAYHLKEDADGELTAENLGAEVKTVEEAAEETVKETGETSEQLNTVGTDEDGAIEDGIIEDDVTDKVTRIEAETDGFSYYVVEFTYHLLNYTLVGTTTKLSPILYEFGITATPSEATVSDASLLTVTKDAEGEDWTVEVLKGFDLATMSVTTVTDHRYEIKVSNALLDSVTRQNINYTDEHGFDQSQNCIIMMSADGYMFEAGEWYAVTGDVTIKNRIENNAAKDTPAHLILVDEKTLTASQGINTPNGKGLVIYGQSAGTGKLDIPGAPDYSAGIGGGGRESGGNITIYGGTVTVTGGYEGAGIGGGFEANNDGTITINGGTVTATGGVRAAGIGGGEYGQGETVIITGGNVTAYGGQPTTTGGNYTCGIGHGQGGDYGIVNITGGTVNAYGGGGYGKGIGEGNRTIDSKLMIYAGKSRETAKRSNPEGVGAMYVFISDACKEVNYTVTHRWQKADSSEYEVYETDPLQGGVGWQTEAVAKNYAGFTAQAFSQKTIASDGKTDVTIDYNRNTYTITLNTNGRGVVPEPIKARYGVRIDRPQDPVCEGYLFKDWYKERECINPYTFSTMPPEDLTLYAKWELDPTKRQNVQYVDEDGSTKTAPCIILSKDADFYTFDTGEWYAVTGSITIANRIENRAAEDSPAHLILTDGASLAVKGGIHNPSGKGLVIYGQSIGNGTLSISNVPGHHHGIGGDITDIDGEITINGGTVTVTGGEWGSGIGGKTTINGGTVTATGGEWGSGIGGKTTINDGTVTATGGKYGTGISGEKTINGGTVTATGGELRSGIGDKTTINGGTVTATGGIHGAGIGGGDEGKGGEITINGGMVTATGGIYGAGIGGGNKGNGGEVTINGGMVTATGGELGAAIGGGKEGNGGTLVFGIKPGVLRAGANKDDASDVDADIYKDKHQEYSFVIINCATASYTVEHWKQKTIRGDVYEKDAEATETLTGFVDTYAEVVSKEYQGYGEPQYTPEKIKADGTTKIVAKYDLIYSTISFDANGHGIAPEPIYATPGAAITAPEDPFAEGYKFDGWFTDKKCTDQFTFSTMPSKNTMLYAKWTIQYTITWKDWDGKVLASVKVDENSLPKYPGASKPSRSGYIFTGWTPEIDLATANTIYTATYEKKSSGGGGSGSGGGGGGSAVITYAEKPAVTPITVAANGSQMMGTAVVSIPAVQLAKSGAAPVPGAWSKANGMWTFTKADGNKAKNEWVLITVAGGNASYFYFDSNANMVTGWQRVGGKWMYFNNESGSLLGACLRGPGRTPDGYEIDAAGAWTGR